MYRVFVSFDWENDRHYKYLLEAWHANPAFAFTFYDSSAQEIDSDAIDRIKAGLTRKINEATHTLVIVGREANKRHPDYLKIGYRNWQIFEIERSKASGNRIAAVKLSFLLESPAALRDCGTSWARTFTEDAIIAALRNA